MRLIYNSLKREIVCEFVTVFSDFASVFGDLDLVSIFAQIDTEPRRDLRRDGGRDRDQDGHDGDRGRRQPNAAAVLTQTLTWLMSTGEGDS